MKNIMKRRKQNLEKDELLEETHGNCLIFCENKSKLKENPVCVLFKGKEEGELMYGG